jgi:hypothetical protein
LIHHLQVFKQFIINPPIFIWEDCRWGYLAWEDTLISNNKKIFSL